MFGQAHPRQIDAVPCIQIHTQYLHVRQSKSNRDDSCKNGGREGPYHRCYGFVCILWAPVVNCDWGIIWQPGQPPQRTPTPYTIPYRAIEPGDWAWTSCSRDGERRLGPHIANTHLLPGGCSITILPGLRELAVRDKTNIEPRMRVISPLVSRPPCHLLACVWMRKAVAFVQGLGKLCCISLVCVEWIGKKLHCNN